MENIKLFKFKDLFKYQKKFFLRNYSLIILTGISEVSIHSRLEYFCILCTCLSISSSVLFVSWGLFVKTYKVFSANDTV